MLGDIANPSVPLDLVDSQVYLAVSQSFVNDESRPGGIHLVRYEYRVGHGSGRGDWLLRYEYAEDPASEYEGQYLYANAHLHVNALPAGALLARPLPEVHFPTRKMWLEEVLAGVCSDIILPRLRRDARDEGAVLAALRRLTDQIAFLSRS